MFLSLPVTAACRAFVAVLLLALSAAPARSQSQPDIDASRLALGADTLAVFRVRGDDTVRTGIIVDVLSIVERDGRRLLHRVYVTDDEVLGLSLDTIIDAMPDLTPVRHRRVSNRQGTSLDFAGGHVNGSITLATGETVPIAQEIPDGVIGAASFDIALRASPLAAEWSGDFPAFLEDSRTVGTLHARSAGIHTIAGETCWRVQAEFAGLPVTFWISTRSRRLRQQLIVIEPDFAILFAPVPEVRRRPGVSS
jgi:hypothetical protein